MFCYRKVFKIFLSNFPRIRVNYIYKIRKYTYQLQRNLKLGEVKNLSCSNKTDQLLDSTFITIT